MEKADLQNVYYSRPFKTRNADEYDLENILDLFIDPTDGLIGPFEFANSIIKGKMGSGKTMYLRANYANYLHTLVPCLIDGGEIILPVYIKLSDFQNQRNPGKIYEEIIINIVEEIVSVCDHLKSADELARLHTGARAVGGLWTTDTGMSQVLARLSVLTAEEYVDHVSKSIETKGGIAAKFVDIYSNYSATTVSEIKRKGTPCFQDIVDACETLLTPFNGKLLILFDEIGSLNKSFFKASSNTSYFETLMNQLRTLSYVRTKLAVYPHTYSDILKETRYGDIVELECDVVNNELQYRAFMEKTVSLMERYIEKSSGIKCEAEDIFEITVSNQLLVEQLINASEGNMRRLVHLLDMSMNNAFARHHGSDRVQIDDVTEALKKQGAEMENLHRDSDKDFLDRLAKVCRSRSTYRFTFPNKSTLIGKYTNLSEEYNVVNIRQAGSGRQGTVYSFDYAYCIYKDIPTHYVKGSEKIDKARSRTNGESIKRVAQLSDELLMQSEIRNKIEGDVSFFVDSSQNGFIEGTDGHIYFFTKKQIIVSDRKQPIHVGSRVRFIPAQFDKDSLLATSIEIL